MAPEPPQNALWSEAEKPCVVFIEGGRCCLPLGPIGQRIIDERAAQDMKLLRDCLTFTDGDRTVTVGWHLPLRNCDYALLVAEQALGKDEGRVCYSSINPFTTYEIRDAARQTAYRKLFAADLHLPEISYIYVDQHGHDVSDVYRATPDWP